MDPIKQIKRIAKDAVNEETLGAEARARFSEIGRFAGQVETWVGVIPDIFGYGMTVVSGSRDGAMKALKAEYRRWKKSLGDEADPNTTFASSYENFGGRVSRVETDKVYYENFGE